MNKEEYVEISKENLKLSAIKLDPSRRFNLQLNDDSKHTSV